MTEEYGHISDAFDNLPEEKLLMTEDIQQPLKILRMGTMIKLLNKILAKFQLELISTKVDTNLVESTVKFMNENPKYFDGYNIPESTYIGDISYVQERVEGEFPQVSGTTYFKSQIPTEKKSFFNFGGEKLDEQELVEKLKND